MPPWDARYTITINVERDLSTLQLQSFAEQYQRQMILLANPPAAPQQIAMA